MKTEIQIVGVQRTVRAMRNKAVKDVIAIHDGLVICGGIILRKSNYYVPKDTLRLMRSGTVTTNGKRGFNADVIVSYSAPYAIYVHERTDLAHAAPTSARYLARAVVETRGTCVSVLKRQIAVGMK